MANSPWVPAVRHTQDGEAVRAGVDGRPTRDLEGRTNYLKALLEAAYTGQALFARDQVLDPAVRVGDPVYLNPLTRRLEQAYATYETDPVTGALRPGPGSFVFGFVFSKTTATRGDVLTLGMVALDVTAQTGDPAPAGPYYLGTAPGTLVRGPGIGPLLGIADGAGNFLFVPGARDAASAHTHYARPLVCRPAGDYTRNPGGRQAIFNADPALPGWLPARHAAFNNRAPRNAAFGYNLPADPTGLGRLYPPAPISGSALTWDKGDRTGATEIPLGTGGLVVLDRYGIWWMSDNDEDVPWPADQAWEHGMPAGASLFEGPSSSSVPNDPRSDTMRLVLYFVRSLLGTDLAAVTSLAPADGSPIEVLDAAGHPATAGCLFLALANLFALTGDDSLLGLAVKEQVGQKFKRGPVITGLASPDASIVLTPADPAQKVVIGGVTYYYGLVTAQADLEPGDKLLPAQTVYLDDTPQRTYQNVQYLGFPAGQASDLRIKFLVPAAGLPGTPLVKVRLYVFAPTAGTTPNLTATYRRLPKVTTPAALPTSETALTLTMSQACTAGQYYVAESAGFTVAAGDVVFLTLSRSSGDGYAGELGVVDVSGVLYQGP